VASAPTQLPDLQLSAAARAGEEAAWVALVEHYYAPILRYLTAQTGDPEAAAELAQDTFLAAGALRHRLPADRPFAAWLYRVAQNHLWRWRRRRGLLHFVSLDWLFERSGPTVAPLRHPEDVEVAVADVELVRHTLGRLSPLLREALLLHDLAGFTAPEVAQILGISLAAAERRISRAKERFRGQYRALADEEEVADGQAWVPACVR
jgi:RNA polymerase sigma-70 factor (ECF subfamily)